MRTPNGDDKSISPVTGLRSGTDDERVAELVGIGARDVDARQRALKALVRRRQLDRHERAADRRPATASSFRPSSASTPRILRALPS